MLCDQGTDTPAGPRNLPLGILSIFDYDQFDIEMQEGDCVVAFTDALIESQDADGEMLGEEGVFPHCSPRSPIGFPKTSRPTM